MATLIKVDGTETDMGKISFEAAKIAIGCDMIQILRLTGGRIMAFDEDGKMKSNPQVNEKATSMTRGTGVAPWDLIVGNVIVYKKGEFK